MPPPAAGSQAQPIRVYQVWDVPVRLFHWINVLCVLSLLFLGLIMLFKKELGITGLEAKIALKEVHVIVGYVFASNLLLRFAWAFMGNRYARWSAFWPGLAGPAAAFAYLRAGQGRAQPWLGHNPAGRLAVSVLFLMLAIMAVTGLVRAGTDIYYPPFGSSVQTYVAAEGVEPSAVQPYQEAGVDVEKLERLQAFKEPFGKVHLYTAYALIGLILLHVVAVIVTESREGGTLISAMFTGKKYLTRQPADTPD